MCLCVRGNNNVWPITHKTSGRGDHEWEGRQNSCKFLIGVHSPLYSVALKPRQITSHEKDGAVSGVGQW